jgi:hypothetical protein
VQRYHAPRGLSSVLALARLVVCLASRGSGWGLWPWVKSSNLEDQHSSDSGLSRLSLVQVSTGLPALSSQLPCPLFRIGKAEKGKGVKTPSVQSYES